MFLNAKIVNDTLAIFNENFVRKILVIILLTETGLGKTVQNVYSFNVPTILRTN